MMVSGSVWIRFVIEITTDKPLDELYGMWKNILPKPKGISLDGVADDERLVLNKLNGSLAGRQPVPRNCCTVYRQ